MNIVVIHQSRSGNTKKAAELLGGAVNDGALKLFPAFANVAGLDTSKIEILNFKSNLREQMLKN